jgi:hypothetical protein
VVGHGGARRKGAPREGDPQEARPDPETPRERGQASGAGATTGR